MILRCTKCEWRGLPTYLRPEPGAPSEPVMACPRPGCRGVPVQRVLERVWITIEGVEWPEISHILSRTIRAQPLKLSR